MRVLHPSLVFPGDHPCRPATLLLSACAFRPLLSGVQVRPETISPNADGQDDVTLVEYSIGRTANVSIYFVDAQGERHYFRNGERRSRGDYKVYWGGVTNQIRGAAGRGRADARREPGAARRRLYVGRRSGRRAGPLGRGGGQDHPLRRRLRPARDSQLHRGAAGLHAQPGRHPRPCFDLLLPDERRRARRRLPQAGSAATREQNCCAIPSPRTRRSRCRRRARRAITATTTTAASTSLPSRRPTATTPSTPTRRTRSATTSSFRRR